MSWDKQAITKIVSNKGILIILGLGLLPILMLFYTDLSIECGSKFDIEILNKIGGFLAGTTGLLWGLASIIFIYKSFLSAQKQQAENAFFLMMGTLHKLINNTEGYFMFDSDGHAIREWGGRSIDYFSGLLYNIINDIFKVGGESRYEKVRAGYMGVYNKNQAKLGHLFRLSLGIIMMVHENHLFSRRKKRELVHLIQAQLSNDILAILMYNCYTDVGAKYLTALENGYKDFFENLDPKSISDTNDIEFLVGRGFTFKYIKTYEHNPSMKDLTEHNN